MTRSVVVFTQIKPGHEAGLELAAKINDYFIECPPNVVIVFASSIYNYEDLLKSIKHNCSPGILVGASSAGEFTSSDFQVDSVCAVAIHSDNIKFNAGIASGISEDCTAVAGKLSSYLLQVDDYKYQYHSAMLFADALSGYTDELIAQLTERTVSDYQFFGGGAGDNANFLRTHVFFDEKAYTNAAVILEILSNKPVGIGISNGWKPSSKKMRVTEADGRRLISINSRPALDVYKEHAIAQGKVFDLEQPVPYFLSNILGIEMASGFKLRAPLGIGPDGSIILASDMPVGVYVYIMSSDAERSKQAAVDATENALAQLGDAKPNVAIFFDCVATRLRMGEAFDVELSKLSEALEGVPYAGCNTYGQVARVTGQFSGFQNCSAVVCVIPE